VGLPQLRGRDPLRPFPPAAGIGRAVEVVEVGVEVPLEEIADRAAHPGRHVDAVRDRLDLVGDDAPPRVVRGLGVEPTDGIRPVRQPEAERGHVEDVRVAIATAPYLEEPVDRTPPVFGRPSPSSIGPATRRTRPASNARCPPRPGCGS